MCFWSIFGRIFWVIFDVLSDTSFFVKNSFFWKVQFYDGESTTFGGQGSIWRVPWAAKMSQKWSQRGLKHRCRKNIKYQQKMKNVVKRWPQRSAAYTVQNWGLQFCFYQIPTKNGSQKVVNFEVLSRLFGVQKVPKMIPKGHQDCFKCMPGTSPEAREPFTVLAPSQITKKLPAHTSRGGIPRRKTKRREGK